MRHVRVVAEQQLEGVLARGKIDGGLGLATAEVYVVRVCRDGLGKVRKRGIDYEVMVPGFLLYGAGRRHAEAF